LRTDFSSLHLYYPVAATGQVRAVVGASRRADGMSRERVNSDSDGPRTERVNATQHGD